MSRATIAMHAANHRPGGSDPLTIDFPTLETTDGVATIDPTGTLAFPVGRGLEVTNPGGDTASVALRAIPFVYARHDSLVVPGDSSSFTVDFHDAGATFETNDVDGETGYKTDAGGSFDGDAAWEGDYFRSDVAAATSAFRTDPTHGGLYLVDVHLDFRVVAAAGTVQITVQWPTTVLGNAGVTNVAVPFLAGQTVTWHMTAALLQRVVGGTPNTDFAVKFSQDSGSNSQSTNTTAQIACYRLSPS